MRKHVPVNILVHHPSTDTGREELARRVAQIHADAVTARIQHLNCPAEQKMQLLDAIIADARTRVSANAARNPTYPVYHESCTD